MTKEELVTNTVSRYVAILRIESAENRETEIQTQKQELRVMLQSLGVAVDDIKVFK